ncbi:hypothetical protein DPMN_181675 [Dreissena polymorpha]|uniref:Uncharacterized protein n=1 Tax=Dreissena polymorpha TaxID=45954 RepID=A0A9D4I5I9_DREPO|nr:hypothetical protein DPMN_181675 [Dreissena polymorpha]
MLVTLVCFLGLLLIGIAAFLTFRKLIGRPRYTSLLFTPSDAGWDHGVNGCDRYDL